MSEEVLIIYNSFDKELLEERGVAWQESNAGVMEEVNAVKAAFDKLAIKYQTESVADIEQLNDILSRCNQKIVFNLVEELPGEIWDACYVPVICKSHGKACTGNDTPSLLLAQNKWHTKSIFDSANIPSPEGIFVPIGQKIRPADLKGWHIVKPAFSEASEGIDADSVVDIPGSNIHKAIERVHTQSKQPAIVEQFINGREFNVCLLQRNGKAEVMPIVEIDFSAFAPGTLRIVDYSAKWVSNSFAYNNTPRIIPAPLPSGTTEVIRQYALKVWDTISCQDYVRVDLRMTAENEIFILEVNTNPDISLDCAFAAATAAGGVSYEEFIKTLIDNTIERYTTKYRSQLSRSN